METLINILGWVGSAEVILAFGLNTYQKIKSDSLAYILLNITGGVFLIVYSVYHNAFANAVINIVWVIVALAALIKMGVSKK